MPGGGGPEAARGILAESPRTRIVALSAYGDRASILEMLRAGAAAYLVKGSMPDEVTQTIQRVLRGESAFSPDVASTVVRELSEQLAGKEEAETRSKPRAGTHPGGHRARWHPPRLPADRRPGQGPGDRRGGARPVRHRDAAAVVRRGVRRRPPRGAGGLRARRGAGRASRPAPSTPTSPSTSRRRPCSAATSPGCSGPCPSSASSSR